MAVLDDGMAGGDEKGMKGDPGARQAYMVNERFARSKSDAVVTSTDATVLELVILE